MASVNSRVGPMVTVYRVTTDLPAFTTLSSENTEPAEVPERWAADNTVLKSADIDGRVIATPLTAGSRSVWTSWSAERPRPHRARDRGQRGRGHRPGRPGRPGDRVDVYAVFSEVPGLAKQSRILVQNVRVISVQGQLQVTSPDESRSRTSSRSPWRCSRRPRGRDLRQLLRRGGPARRAAARRGAGPQQGERTFDARQLGGKAIPETGR